MAGEKPLNSRKLAAATVLKMVSNYIYILVLEKAVLPVLPILSRYPSHVVRRCARDTLRND